MKIGIGNDHGATDLKLELVAYLKAKGYEVVNYGIDNHESIDYPIIAEKVAKAVVNQEVDRAILMCGTGIGVSLAANKVNGIRAACVSDCFSAKMAREHNNANILCFGGRVVGPELAKLIVDSYLETEFLGGRHQRRVDLITDIQERN